MSTEKYTVGVDFGTLSGRALVVRIADGQEMGSAEYVYPHGVITDGFANKTGRQIKLSEGRALDEPAFVELVRAIAAMNRAGGWRALKASD